MKKFFPLLIILCFTFLLPELRAVEPTVQAYNIAFSNVGDAQLRLAFTRGNGTYRIVVARQTSDVGTIGAPVDGNDYTASATFGDGSNLGSNTYVVYEGTGRAVTITGLNPGLPYAFQVYEFNGTGTNTDYLTDMTDVANNPRYTYTRPDEPALAWTTDETDVSFMANWAQPEEGNWEGYELQVATDENFNNLIEGYDPVELGIDLDPEPYFLVEDLTANTTYYWRVRSRMEFRFSDWVLPDSAAITTPAAPTVDAIAVCEGETATITPTAPDPETHTFYFYDAETGGTPLGTGSSFTTDELTENTTFYVSAVNNNTGRESARTTVVISVEQAPTPNISGETTVCSGNTTDTYSITGADGNTYTWTVTGGTVTAGEGTNEITITWGEAGTGQILVSEATSAGCTGYDTLDITIQASPTPSISGVTEACVNEESVTYSIIDNGNTMTWTVTGGTIESGQGTNLISVNWGSDSTGTIVVSETAEAGCTGTDTLTVTLQTIPTPVITGDSLVCAGEESVVYSTDSTGNTFLWTVTGGTIDGDSTGNTVTINWTDAGSAMLSVVETTTAGCQTEATYTVTVQAMPAPVITGDSLVCANEENVMFSVDLNEDNTYLWTVTGATIQGDSTGNTVLVNFGEAGTATINLTETTTGGCETAATAYIIEIQAAPTPDITGDTVACAGSLDNVFSVTDTDNNFVWSVTGGTITGDNTGNSVNINFDNDAETAVIVVSESTTGGCTTYDTLNVTLDAAPAPSVTGTDVVCANTTGMTYTTTLNEGNTYIWTITGGTITEGDSTNEITVTWGEAGTASLIVTETNATGCAVSDTLSVTVEAIPTPAIIGSTPVCANEQDATYSVTSTDNTFTWTITGGTITSGQGTNLISVNWTDADSGIVVVSEETEAGCFAADTFIVEIQALPVATISGTDSVCANETNLTYTIEATDDTIDWTVIGGTIISGNGTNELVVDWDDTTTTGSIIVNVSSDIGCSAVDTLDINVYPVPDVTIEANSNVCAFETGTVFHTIDDDGDYDYNWTVTGTGTIASGQGTSAILIDWGEAGTSTVIVDLTTQQGCTVSDTLTVTVNPLPEPAITGTSDVCIDEVVTYSITAQEGNTYMWTVMGGTINGSDTSSSIEVTWGEAGDGVVTVIESDELGCSASDNLSVVIYPTPTPAITGTLEACTNNELVYTTTGADGNTYDWTVQGGTIMSGTGTNSITIRWDEGGTGTLFLTETNPAGCSTSDTLDIEVQAVPTPSIAGTASACANTSMGYSVELNEGNTYAWTVTGGTVSGSSTGDSVTITWGGTGTGSLIIAETTTFGCVAYDTLNVTINAVPTPSISGLNAVCANETDITYSVTDNPGSIYVWTITGGTIDGDTSTASITVNWGAAGTGTLTLTETNANGCSATVTRNVTIRPLPTPDITGETHICEGETVTYSTANNAGSTYQWVANQGTILSGQGTNSVSIMWDMVDGDTTLNATVSVTETLPTGCSATENMAVLIHPIPEPDITGETTVCENTSGVQYSVDTNNGNTYAWVVTGGTIASGSGTSTITVNWGNEGAGSIRITETSPAGCIGRDTIQVTIDATPTPNITGDFSVCANDSNMTFETATTTNTFAWTITGATIQGSTTGNSVVVNFGEAGTATLVVTETTTAGCSVSDTATITINAQPTPDISGDTLVCVNATNEQYTTASNAGSTYLWTVTGGTVASGGNTNTVSINWGDEATGTLTVRETNAAGCFTEVTETITLQAFPTPSITGPINVIEDSTYTFSVTQNEGNTYAWTVTGGTIDDGDGTNEITVTFGSAGTGSVTITETSAAGCSTTVTQSITIRRANEPVQLAIITEIGRQVSGTPFSVTVQAQTENGTPANVDANTPITIGINTGEGSVIGFGSISAGSSQTTINVTYQNTNGETGVILSADDGAGGLTPGLSNAFTVLAPAPTQASNIVWDSFDTSSISLSWTNGGGTGRLVLAKQTNSFTSNDNPQDGVGYTANSVFGSGSQIGNAYVVYNSTGNSVTVTGLQRNTRYWFKVFEYNGSGEDSTINYNTNAVTNNPRSRFTAPRMPVIDESFPTASEGGLIYMSNFMPNPATDRINFNIQLTEGQNVSISIMTLSGQTVMSPINGEFYEGGPIHNINIPISGIAAGTYIITVTAGDEMVMEKIMIIH